jgi:integrase
MGQWLAHGRRLPAPDRRPELTVDELILRYWKFAQENYTRDGVTSRELDNIRDALRHMRPLHGSQDAGEFGPVALKAVRRAMIGSGLSRSTINARISKVCRMFKWAVSEELLPPSTYEALRTVEGLRPGKDDVRETGPVLAVPQEHIAAVLPYVTRPVRAMIELQNVTGMRPGEVMQMCCRHIDQNGPIWVYRPPQHKTLHRGLQRLIPLGPKAQAILGVFLERDPDDFLFRPVDAVSERNERRRNSRRSPMTPSQGARRPNSAPKRSAGLRYTKRSYHCARWFPNQIRHTAATRIRQLYGLEAAQTVLGHTRADVTQIYAEREIARAYTVMAEIG